MRRATILVAVLLVGASLFGCVAPAMPPHMSFSRHLAPLENEAEEAQTARIGVTTDAHLLQRDLLPRSRRSTRDLGLALLEGSHHWRCSRSHRREPDRSTKHERSLAEDPAGSRVARPCDQATRWSVCPRGLGEVLAEFLSGSRSPERPQRRSGLLLLGVTLPSNAPDDCLDACLTRLQ